MDRKVLLKLWLVEVTAERPSLTKAFQISLLAQDQNPSVKVCMSSMFELGWGSTVGSPSAIAQWKYCMIISMCVQTTTEVKR